MIAQRGRQPSSAALAAQPPGYPAHKRPRPLTLCVCLQVPFTPRRWRPTHPDVPQVPFTFALRPAPPRAPGKRARSGSKGAGEDAGGGLGKRTRVRKLLPTAWTTGEAAAGSVLGVGCDSG